MNWPDWFDAASPAELRDAAGWLQDDARYLYAQARRYGDRLDGTSKWLAIGVQENAAHSAALARAAFDKFTGSTAP